MFCPEPVFFVLVTEGEVIILDRQKTEFLSCQYYTAFSGLPPTDNPLSLSLLTMMEGEFLKKLSLGQGHDITSEVLQ